MSDIYVLDAGVLTPIPDVTTTVNHATVAGMPAADPVGVLEVADRLGVKDRTVHKWLQLGQMPDGDYSKVNGSRAWEWSTILRWAGDKGRLRTPLLVDAYRALFHVDPSAARNAGRPLKITQAEIDEIAASDAPARDLAAKFAVSEAYVWKVRRLHRPPAVPVKKAARKMPAKKKAAPARKSAKKATRARRPVTANARARAKK